MKLYMYKIPLYAQQTGLDEVSHCLLLEVAEEAE